METPRNCLLPIRKRLMARFADWATGLTPDKARAFAANPDVIGERFLGRHTLATTSGTTRTPGILTIDEGACA